nr:MAG TPA: hypothetical protein [Caudoviricetes sp.]
MWVKSRRKNTEGKGFPYKEKLEGKQFPLKGKIR